LRGDIPKDSATPNTGPSSLRIGAALSSIGISRPSLEIKTYGFVGTVILPETPIKMEQQFLTDSRDKIKSAGSRLLNKDIRLISSC
jgi:hypothetical protein